MRFIFIISFLLIYSTAEAQPGWATVYLKFTQDSGIVGMQGSHRLKQISTRRYLQKGAKTTPCQSLDNVFSLSARSKSTYTFHSGLRTMEITISDTYPGISYSKDVYVRPIRFRSGSYVLKLKHCKKVRQKCVYSLMHSGNLKRKGIEKVKKPPKVSATKPVVQSNKPVKPTRTKGEKVVKVNRQRELRKMHNYEVNHLVAFNLFGTATTDLERIGGKASVSTAWAWYGVDKKDVQKERLFQLGSGIEWFGTNGPVRILHSYLNYSLIHDWFGRPKEFGKVSFLNLGIGYRNAIDGNAFSSVTPQIRANVFPFKKSFKIGLHFCTYIQIPLEAHPKINTGGLSFELGLRFDPFYKKPPPMHWYGEY